MLVYKPDLRFENQDNYLMFQGSQAFCMHWGLWNYTIGWGNANKTA